MSKKVFKAFLVLASLVLFFNSYSFAAGEKMSGRAINFRLGYQHIWTEHAFLERADTIAEKNGDTDVNRVIETKIIKNSEELGNALEPFYGRRPAYLFFNVLTAEDAATHVYTMAVFSGDMAAKKAAVELINKSTDDIAAFLSSLNPNLPKSKLVSLLNTAMQAQMAQIDAVASGDSVKEEEAWDVFEKSVSDFAGAIADGIIKQFPQKF